eukprot:546096_1
MRCCCLDSSVQTILPQTSPSQLMSASFDYSYLDMNTAQQLFPLKTYADSEPAPRRVSWDDSSLYYQTANEWDYPICSNYKSQNPSPKHDNHFKYNDNNCEISPLTTINGYEDSETEDMDTTSASSIDENLFNEKQGSRISMEDIADTEEEEHEDEDNSSNISIIQTDEDEKDNKNNNNNNNNDKKNNEIRNG